MHKKSRLSSYQPITNLHSSTFRLFEHQTQEFTRTSHRRSDLSFKAEQYRSRWGAGYPNITAKLRQIRIVKKMWSQEGKPLSECGVPDVPFIPIQEQRKGFQ